MIQQKTLYINVDQAEVMMTDKGNIKPTKGSKLEHVKPFRFYGLSRQEQRQVVHFYVT